LVETGFHDFRSGLSTGTLLAQFFAHTRYKEIPINKNKTVQTGAKTQFGGLKKGFSRKKYQLLIAGVMKIEPKTPASSQINMLIINFAAFFISLILILIDLFFSSCRFLLSDVQGGWQDPTSAFLFEVV